MCYRFTFVDVLHSKIDYDGILVAKMPIIKKGARQVEVSKSILNRTQLTIRKKKSIQSWNVYTAASKLMLQFISKVNERITLFWFVFIDFYRFLQVFLLFLFIDKQQYWLIQFGNKRYIQYFFFFSRLFLFEIYSFVGWLFFSLFIR